MFFRRAERTLTIDDRLAQARQAGFGVQAPQDGKCVATRGAFGGILDISSGNIELKKAGLIIGSEIGALTHVGFQMWFVTHSGKKAPASAEQLRSLHDFTEDLKEALGLTSFYNESLGTVNSNHVYDRVEDRDEHKHAKPWTEAR